MSRRVFHRLRWFVLLALAWCAGAAAHPAGVTATDVFLGAERVEVVYTVPKDDVWRLRGGERPATVPGPDAYMDTVRGGFSLSDAGHSCRLSGSASTVLADIGSYEYRLRYHCPRPLERLSLEYRLFVDFDRAHRNLARVFAGELGTRAVLHQGRRSLAMPVAELRSREGFALPVLAERPQPPGSEAPDAGAFFRLGVEHIVTGYDHLLFLAGLILVSLRFSSIAVLVTAFTVAHSITLALAALQVFTLPVVLTESLIALSVAWVGGANVAMVFRHVAPGRLLDPGAAAAFRRVACQRRPGRWLLTFVFGLIHGVGFAGMLRQIGLPSDGLVNALALFNVGVEAGQLAAVALGYPLLRLLARYRVYPAAVAIGSAALVLAGLVWFVLRVLG